MQAPRRRRHHVFARADQAEITMPGTARPHHRDDELDDRGPRSPAGPSGSDRLERCSRLLAGWMGECHSTATIVAVNSRGMLKKAGPPGDLSSSGPRRRSRGAQACTLHSTQEPGAGLAELLHLDRCHPPDRLRPTRNRMTNATDPGRVRRVAASRRRLLRKSIRLRGQATIPEPCGLRISSRGGAPTKGKS